MLWSFLQLCFLCCNPPNRLLHMNGLPDRMPPKSVVTWTTEQEHDFGAMQQGRPQIFVFQFRNIDSDSILLQTVRTSCGCTAANWTETPIAPGASGEVRIEYDAYQNGDFDKKIRVFFDRQRKPEILRIRGKVES